MQSLFEWDFRGFDKKTALKVLERNVEEFAAGENDIDFIENLYKTVLEKRKELDLIITKAAPDWPVEKISIIDRNVLRIGLSELLFADRKEVPPKVAINEAIELAKNFGGETSGKFVNGVLGAVYKEMGEPGKDEVSTKKKNPDNIPDEKAPLLILGGAVVYSEKEGRIYIALVHDVFGHWTLSKGKLEDNEDIKAGTIREIKEELGLDIEIEQELGVNEYIAYHPEHGKLRKRVYYFLARSQYAEMILEKEGGLDNAKWFSLDQIAELNFYDDVLPLVTKAVMILARAQQNKK
ncbi:MAG: transcription antitermination factor NusB [Candidatus Zambryskibacteria bacterium RIFCSPHIGHO2_01_FULL_43_25]|uniref:Transcription antitermination protein NusB n=1 Tax=Candidatus Zambryskibacteria bacterium RIFCSPLOWO2_01_FULL_45_21 TaxID=1802761 RepID=A0A1G2U3Z3_9BACT|nr:MAG: transcription antitermination factor NusB [Candidatus Zambryskibacteria bacterium RIFCSPHIGHO2_01_FULL_43_25]OHB00394.1 MAG: transcription antitermination factor NusB [Candidatus Zambryskibacteria bacterium RIFCSPHIGHO2_12_FULL_44_12b]OHB04189.1 MAG: transcription antitermination factor NusB [Candidatus Zambryskibacteria bacterium RIFCSPLOWO2_01_FULL_45_21]